MSSLGEEIVLVRAAGQLKKLLTPDLSIKLIPSTIMSPDHISISKRLFLFGYEKFIAKIYYDSEKGIELVFEDPVEEIIKAVSSLTVS